jgi:16S rRNA (guanine527-N7)-methyltransferase
LSLLTQEQVSEAVLSAGLLPIEDEQARKLVVYGNLILKWNARTNLTGISDPEILLQRHLVESIAAAQALPPDIASLLDYGTGAGLPGIPIVICRPEIQATLAESQMKKVAFLREAVRSLSLQSEIFAGRVSALESRFDVVTLRAVDKMDVAIRDAVSRVNRGGLLALFATAGSDERLLAEFEMKSVRRVPLPTVGHLLLIREPVVPRRTKA